ncbi:MAG: NUDIX domain-containing protein [Candidatus Aenigmarchaeota archaeon]|nr:NUDIX domain-containing protein [Candidatus Aenigmarchaeota archaeon]
MRQAVGGALFNNGKLLVVKRVASEIMRPNDWEIPGGKNEEGESDGEALRREFIEETQIKVNVKERYHTFHYDYKGEPAEENDYFVASDSYDVKIGPQEHSEFRWVTKDEARALKMSAEMKKSVMKAFAIVQSASL